MKARPMVFAILAFAVVLTVSPLPALELTLSAAGPVVSGLAPGGEIVYLSVAREASGYAANVVRREGRLKDDDSDGVVSIELDRPVPFRSIWVVVEVATGRVLAATPEGYPLRDAEPGGGFAVAQTEGVITRIGARGDLSHVLVVRPGGGAWVATLVDGSAGDEDGPANRTVQAALAGLEPLANGPPPPLELAAGDLVIEIDSDAMAWALEVVGGAP